MQYRNAVPKYRHRMIHFRKVPKYRNRMTHFQVPNSDTAGNKKVPNPSSVHLLTCCKDGKTIWLVALVAKTERLSDSLHRMREMPNNLTREGRSSGGELVMRAGRLYEAFWRGPTVESLSNVTPMFLALGLHVSCPHETEWILDLSRSSFDESTIAWALFY